MTINIVNLTYMVVPPGIAVSSGLITGNPLWPASDRETERSRHYQGAVMARFFFHVMNGKAVIDEVGVELPNMDRVRSEAMRTAGQMLSDGDQAWRGRAWQMMVTDDADTIVFGVNISIDRHGL